MLRPAQGNRFEFFDDIHTTLAEIRGPLEILAIAEATNYFDETTDFCSIHSRSPTCSFTAHSRESPSTPFELAGESVRAELLQVLRREMKKASLPRILRIH